MGIILFLVDTSASMNQKTYLGASYLDVAKVAIETFLKYRSREPSSRFDRYMLVSFDEPPNCIKAGWKTSNAGFISQLKNLQATSLSTFAQSLRESFDLLNIHRLHTSIDHYGQGRNPFFLEPAVVIALTDGGKANNLTMVENEFNICHLGSPPEGSELTNQPYRWDQRLFTVLLRLPGVGEERNSLTSETTQDNTYLLGEGVMASMCEMTGGKSYIVTNQKSLVQSMESLTQKLQHGVVIHFKKIGGVPSPRTGEQENMDIDGDHVLHNGNANGLVVGEDQKGGGEGVAKSSTAWHNTRKLIYVKSRTGFWPIPESFWPDTHTVTLPPRDVHPVVWFDTTDVSPMLVEKFPFDKYELEPSPLTQCILAKRNANVCWQVFVSNSGKVEGLTHPFGYLKASSNLTHVTLFVMPFNYRDLLPLAEDLLNNRLRPSNQWRQKFTNYISTVPAYYAQPLRKAFEMMGAPSNIIPDSFDGQMSYSITNYLRKLKKQAKLDSERILGNISKTVVSEACRRLEGNSIVDLGDGISLAIGSTLKDEEVTSRSFRNPFDITRSGLLGQLARMRTNFLHSTPTTPNLIEEVVRHQVPIGQMGNYQEYLKKMNPLREVDEAGGLRTQLFGNPYKLERPADKASGKLAESADMDIFADEHMVEMNRKSNARVGGARKRIRPRSPYPSRSPTPTPNSPTPPPSALANSVTPAGDSSAEKPAESKLPSKDSPLPVTKEVQNSSSKTDSPEPPTVKEVGGDSPLNSGAEPFTSSALPEERSKTHLNKLNSSRKRERTPSPTPFPNPKRPPPQSHTSSKLTSTLQSLSKGNHVKSPSPVPSSGGGALLSLLGKSEMSSASRVLAEEIHKQENAKLKLLILKEVRKQGKNYQAIFQHLEEVSGSVDTRDSFVCEVIKEAGKFRKKKLVEELEAWRTGLKHARAAAAAGGGGGGGAGGGRTNTHTPATSR